MIEDASDVVDEFTHTQGWSDFSAIQLCCEFISCNPDNVKRFRDFLQGKADEENAYSKLANGDADVSDDNN